MTSTTDKATPSRFFDYQHHVEIDVGFPQVCIEYSAEWEEDDPSVGYRGGWHISGEVAHWMIGNLALTRDQLCLAIGSDAVLEMESSHCQVISDRMNREEKE